MMKDDTAPPLAPSLTQKSSLWFAGLFLILMMIAIPLPRSQAILPGVLGAGFFLFFYLRHKRWPIIDRPLFMICVAVLLIGASSSLWALESAFVLERAGKVAGLLLPGLALLGMATMVVSFKEADRQLFVTLCAIIIGIGGFILFYEYACGYKLTRFLLNIQAGDKVPAGISGQFLMNRGTVFLSLFSLPVFLALYGCPIRQGKKIALGLFMLAGLMAVLSVTQSQTAQIVVLFFFLMLLYPSHHKMARRLLLVAILAGIFLAPVIPPIVQGYISALPLSTIEDPNGFLWAASIPHRIEVWNFVADQIAQQPLLGHGMDSTRFLHSAAMMHYMKTDNVLHPHNAILQVWVEFGIVGAGIAASLIVLLFLRLDRMPACLQRYYTALLIVMLGMLSMGYGLWQAWQLGLIFSIPAFSMMVTRLYPEKFRTLSS